MQLGSFQLPTRWKHYKFPVIQLHFLRRWNNSQANRACLSSWRREKIHLESESPCIIFPRSFVRSRRGSKDQERDKFFHFRPPIFERFLVQSRGGGARWIDIGKPDLSRCTYTSSWLPQGWWMLHTKRWSFEQSMIRHSRSGHGCLVTTRVHIDPSSPLLARVRC